MAKESAVDTCARILIEKIEERRAAGDFVAPWKKTWDPTVGMPRNLTTGKAYRGSNIWMTMLQGYESPFWVTRRQIKSLGGIVKKEQYHSTGSPGFVQGGTFERSERYTPITFWWFPDANNPKDNGRVPFCKFYQVWNTEQVDGIQQHVEEALAGFGPPVNPIEEAEAIVKGYIGAPEIRHGNAKAFYRPSEDRVYMPNLAAFDKAENYYHTLFHELAHSTGHRTRLERDGVANPASFASHEYSEEELIAEMSATMLAGFAGIGSPESEDNAAAYLDFWLGKLKQSPRMLETAGRAAQKAVDKIRDTEWKKAHKA